MSTKRCPRCKGTGLADLDRPDLDCDYCDGDGVIDIVGTSTLLDSLKMVRYRGRVAMAGFLGGVTPLAFDPLMQMPSGVLFSFFASAIALWSASE